MREKIIVIIAILLTFTYIGILDYEGKNYNESITILNEVIAEQNKIIIELQREIDGNIINVDHLIDDMRNLMNTYFKVPTVI